MLIQDLEYKGYTYTIYFNKSDYGSEKNKFYEEGNGFIDVGYHDTFIAVKELCEKSIDGRIDKQLTKDNIYDELCGCLVWSGYGEENELDKTMVLDVLEKYKKQILLGKF